jgi:hypothetical protein
MGTLPGIKVGQDRKNRHQKTHQVTSRVTEKRFRAGEVKRKKTEESAGNQKSEQSDEVLAVNRGAPSAGPCGDNA